MLDFAKKSLYVGLGLATMTKDKLEAFAKDAAEYAKLSEDEGRKLAEFLQAEAKKARANLRETVEGVVNATAEKLPSKRRIERLERRIAAVEQAVGINPPEEPDTPAGADSEEAETGTIDQPDASEGNGEEK